MRSGTVLIVEDFYGIRKSITKMAVNLGLETMIAEDLKAAEKLVAFGKGPNIALIDINLPDGNGLEFIEKHLDYFKDTKVVIVSQAVTKAVFTKAYSIGVKDFLAKPFEPVRLEDMLRGFILDEIVGK